eukprot:1160274-Pelagomonas_calceolata.AAC.4
MQQERIGSTQAWLCVGVGVSMLPYWRYIIAFAEKPSVGEIVGSYKIGNLGLRHKGGRSTLESLRLSQKPKSSNPTKKVLMGDEKSERQEGGRVIVGTRPLSHEASTINSKHRASLARPTKPHHICIGSSEVALISAF